MENTNKKNIAFGKYNFVMEDLQNFKVNEDWIKNVLGKIINQK